MNKLLSICFLAFVISILVIQVHVSDAQVQFDVANFSLFDGLPRSNQRPSQAGIIGVSVSTVLIVVLSCSYVFAVGFYEEFCLSNVYTNNSKKKISKVRTVRYGGSRYGRPGNYIPPATTTA